MNKDVISISPEDDITNVIAEIKSAKNKIIAIVPPQPAGILRSAVNIKLIAKTCEECEKVPVIVTADPALMKLAVSAHIPVADDLQSRPYIPTDEDLKSLEETPKKAAEIAEDFVKPVNNKDDETDEDEDDSNEEDNKKNDKEEKNDKKSSKNDKKDKKKGKSKLAEKFPWIEGKEKPILAALIVVLLLAAFLAYAFIIAPEANIFITIKQSSGNNLSEYVTFTTNQAEENAAAGIFLLEEVTETSESEVVFQATGQKDIGEKASGELDVSIFFDYTNDESGKQVIPKGAEFSLGDKKYVAIEDKTIFWDSEESVCENVDESLSAIEQGKKWKKEGCELSTTVKVEAAEPGEKYNLKDYSVNWAYDFTVQPIVEAIVVSNDSEISGGTTKIVTVIQQSDVDNAKQQLGGQAEVDGKQALKSKMSDTVLPLDNTFSSETSDIVVSPEIGQEVKEGQTAKISSTTTYKIYTIDLVRIEEFIKAKVSISDDQEIFSIGDPYIDRFNKYENGYSGKIKTTYYVGPKISEESVFEKVAGKKVGDAKAQLWLIPGIDKDNVSIETSVLLNSIPDDKNRVHITINRE